MLLPRLWQFVLVPRSLTLTALGRSDGFLAPDNTVRESWSPLVGAASARDTVLGSEATGRILRRLVLVSRRAWMLCHAGSAGCQGGVSLCVSKIWVTRSDPTRLETRTKESNMCASIRVANPDAQRNQEEGPLRGAPPAAPDLL